VLKHLSDHIEEYEKLISLSPARQGLALGKLADRVNAQSAPTPKPVTKAPAPLRTISTGTGKAEKEPAEMTTAEYFEYFKKRKGLG
jgi:hypothetical protein